MNSVKGGQEARIRGNLQGTATSNGGVCEKCGHIQP
jgi:hypothetical protein